MGQETDRRFGLGAWEVELTLRNLEIYTYCLRADNIQEAVGKATTYLETWEREHFPEDEFRITTIKAKERREIHII